MINPKVSIMTASFNSVAYIDKAIQSVLMQNYPNIEYVVMDGGSTDGTLEILKKYEGRLVWVSGPDKGIYDALNKGFARATGDVFTWLDSDNFYESEDVISSVAAAFSKDKNVDVVITNGHRWYPVHNEQEDILPPIPTFESLVNVGNTLVPECTFFSASVFQKVGGFDQSYRLLADYDLWIRMFRERPSVVKLSIVSATYVVREDALLRKGPGRAWHEGFCIGAAYHRNLFSKIRLRIKYSWELVKYGIANSMRKNERLYSWYRNHVRPHVKRLY